MSWKKKKKKIKKFKHKAIIIICLMFTAVIGLIIILCCKYYYKQDNYYKLESRVENLKNEKHFEKSSYKSIGWLKIQGTEIDLPIVYSEYSEEVFPVELENFGWAKKKFDKNSNYYNMTGHNIFNLSATPKIKSDMFNRFEQVMAFIYYDFAKDNEYIQLTVDDEDYIFKIFSVGFLDKASTALLPYNDKPDDYYMERTLKIFDNISLYKYDVDVDTNDKIISLSTCTRFYGADDNTEFYVVGRMLRDGEKINYYKVKKNDNYNEIEKILKGDEK